MQQSHVGFTKADRLFSLKFQHKLTITSHHLCITLARSLSSHASIFHRLTTNFFINHKIRILIFSWSAPPAPPHHDDYVPSRRAKTKFDCAANFWSMRRRLSLSSRKVPASTVLHRRSFCCFLVCCCWWKVFWHFMQNAVLHTPLTFQRAQLLLSLTTPKLPID